MLSSLSIRFYFQAFIMTIGITLVSSCDQQKGRDSASVITKNQTIDTLAAVDNSSFRLLLLRKSQSQESGKSSGDRQFQFLNISIEDLTRYLIPEEVVLDVRSKRSNQFYYEVSFLSNTNNLSVTDGKKKVFEILLNKVIEKIDTTQVMLTNHVLTIQENALDSLISNRSSFSIAQTNNEATLDGVTLIEIENFLSKLHPLQFELSGATFDAPKYKVKLNTENLQSVLSSLMEVGFSIVKEEKSHTKLSLSLRNL